METGKNNRKISLIRRELTVLKETLNQRMGVYILVSHLIITLAVICLYGVSMFSGKDTSVLEGLLFVVFGYWFGSITKDSLKSAERITDTVDKNVNSVNTETVTTETIVRGNNQNENL